MLYDEREKQSKVLKKVIEEKVKKMNGNLVNSNIPLLNASRFELTHDDILEQIDAKGKRGGKRLTKMNH